MLRKNIYKITLVSTLLIFTSCKSNYSASTTKEVNTTSYWTLINKDSISKNLKVLASDELEGRRTGEIGQKKAANFIADYYKRLGILPPKGTDSYFQAIPANFMKGTTIRLKDSENVWAFIEGTEKPEEVLIISAHYDHMGILLGQIYYGADDNGSGTASLMEIARIFKELYNQGIKPKRSVLFLHLTGEEFGLFGSKYYVQNPIIPLKNTIADLNIDMIGRTSPEYKGTKDYIFVVGSDKLSDDLHSISEKANIESVNLDLDYSFNDENDPQQIYYRSDHYTFAKEGIPAIFYYNGTHEDYHLPSDTFDKIDIPLLKKRTQLIFNTAWKLANGNERPKITKQKN